MTSKNWSNLVVILGTITLLVHAILGLIDGEIGLKGGTVLSWNAEPVSYLAIIAIEIGVSAFVFWAYLKKKNQRKMSSYQKSSYNKPFNENASKQRWYEVANCARTFTER